MRSALMKDIVITRNTRKKEYEKLPEAKRGIRTKEDIQGEGQSSGGDSRIAAPKLKLQQKHKRALSRKAHY